MKIVLIDEALDRVGGVERVINTLAKTLCVNYDVKVISEFRTSPKPFYEYDDKIFPQYLIDERNIKIGEIKNKTIKYYFLKIFEKIKRKVLLPYRIKKIIKKFDDEDILIFGRVFVALDFLPILKKSKKNLKIIVRDAIHLEYYKNKIKKKIYKYFPETVDKFIVSSDESIRSYEKFFGIKKINMIKIYNPLGIIPQKCWNEDSKTIISIGRMDEQKGYENLIRAYKILLDKGYREWKLKIYGNGNYQTKIEKLINKLELEKSVELKPSIKDITIAFKDAAIFILPSRYEGYANVLIEAMACGLPVVSYNWLMGVEEIIKDNENGSVVYLKDRYNYFKGIDCIEDSEKMAEKIEILIKDKEMRRKISTNAVKIIESRNVESIIKQWKDLIFEV